MNMSLMLRMLILIFMGVTIGLHADLSPVVKFNLQKDGRKWREELRNESENQSIREYLIENETLQTWTEMFTIQYFHDVPETAPQFFDDFINHLKEKITPHKVKSRIISQTSDSILGEWQIKEGGTLDQGELVRIIKKGDDLLLLHYVTKRLDKLETLKPIWEGILNDATFDAVRYSNDDYSIVLPSDWYIVEAKFEGVTKRSFENPNHTISLLDAEVFKISTKSPEAFLKEASADEDLWGEFDKYENLTLNNGNTVKLMIYKPRLKYHDFETVTMLIPIINGNKLYLMTATFPSKQVQEAKAQVDSIVKTFRVHV